MQTIKRAILAHKEDRLEEAEKLYRIVLESEPDHPDANHNLGILLSSMNKSKDALSFLKNATKINPKIEQFWISYGEILFSLNHLEESETSYNKAIELNPDNPIVYFLLGRVLSSIRRFDEAVKNYKKAINLKPDYINAIMDLGVSLQELGRFDEAVKNYKKVIDLKPDFANAYNNLGISMKNLGKLKESEECLSKAIKLNPDMHEPKKNLSILLKQKEILCQIDLARKSKVENKTDFIQNKILLLNPFISKRLVEPELIDNIYKIDSVDLDTTSDVRFGNGICSDYELFKNKSPIIKNVAEDLTNIIKQAVQSDVYIIESFFNIWRQGSGIKTHTHLTHFDEIYGLNKKKYSLTYYLAIGDQRCSEPGILKLQDPDKEILPSEGTIVIFSAERKHSAAYNGKLDRVMIGVNFYSIL